MADDPHNTSDISDTVDVGSAKEDAETTAARRELKHTTISEKTGKDTATSTQDDKSASGDEAPADKPTLGASTPENGSPRLDHNDLREQVSSPKKKRAHDELDEGAQESPKKGASTTNTTIPIKRRSDRTEPEKKRPRDRQADEEARNSQDEEEPRSDSSARSSLDGKPADAPETKEKEAEKPKTSTSAFANSAFGKLASSTTSPFGALGASSGSKPSLFANTGTTSGFGALGASSSSSLSSTQPKSTFGGGAAAPSPFGTLNGGGKSVFGGGGSAFGSAFGSSAFGATKLSSFAKPGEALKSDKPARPFGAPESDAEDGSGDEDQESGNEDGENEEDKEEQETKELEEKKRIKLQKVEVDNGEGNEVTLLTVRAKMFQVEKGEGWKERGAGMLKVNVPKASIEFDNAGNPDPSSFDASVLDEDDDAALPQNVRLIMRQDHTLRVILNAPILPAMLFDLDKKLKASFIRFTAFDGTEAKLVQLKMSDTNATNLMNLVELLKRGLTDV
ncbi:nucleoporin NUP56 [Naviculisporaceae sp. PSN 640]